MSMFLAQWLVLLGEESLTLQTVITYLKWDKKKEKRSSNSEEGITPYRMLNHGICAQICSKNKNYYIFLRDALFDEILMVDVSITLLSLSQQALNWEQR